LIIISRLFFRFVAPFVAFVCLVLPYVGIADEWIRMTGILFLAATIGFYTNYVAIKMLFRPHEKSRFGRQGLIPKNKQEIAKQLGDSISQEFFDGHEVAKYLRQHQLIESWVDLAFKQAGQRWLHKYVLQSWLQKASLYINQPCAQDVVRDWFARADLEKHLIELLQQADLPQKVTRIVEKEFVNNPERVEKVVDKICYLSAEYVPDVAHYIYREFEEFIEKQGSIKRGIVNFFGWADDINQEKLKEQLFRFISSHEFRDALIAVVHKASGDLAQYAQTDEGKKWIGQMVNNSQQQFSHFLQQSVLPTLTAKVADWLNQPTTLRLLNVYLYRVNRIARQYVHQQIASETFEQALCRWLPQMVSQLKIERLIRAKIENYNTRQLESLVLRATGEHLTIIEVLGGALGGLTGIALINPVVFAALLGCGGMFLLFEKFLTHKS